MYNKSDSVPLSGNFRVLCLLIFFILTPLGHVERADFMMKYHFLLNKRMHVCLCAHSTLAAVAQYKVSNNGNANCINPYPSGSLSLRRAPTLIFE